MFNLQKIVIVFYLIHYNLCYGNDWQSSLTSTRDFLDSEINYIISIHMYYLKEYQKLNEIRSFIEQREVQNEKELAESYTESSINAFKTILRIKTDWETIKNEMAPTKKIEFNGEFLTYDDILKAFKALRRLQIVYEIEVHEMANGNISGYIFNKFDVLDCYQMASICYDNAEFHCAYHWFTETFQKYKDNVNCDFDYDTFIVKYIWSCYLVGNLDKAKDILLYYYHEKNNEYTDNVMSLRYILWNKNEVFKRNTAEDRDKKFYSHTLQKLDYNGDVRSFITACQNWYDVVSYLSCRYFHGNHAFLKIGPLHEENLCMIPNIKLYYNALYKDDINYIKEMATPKLQKLSTDTNDDISVRKVATFTKKTDRMMFGIIEDRISMITSRSIRLINKLTVTNYGLCGHYLPHSDYIDEDCSINYGNHTALVIFHLDDVFDSGATVIPEVDLNVPSIKGSALVVYNTRDIIDPFGRSMFKNTQFGSCPMFQGDKWTITAWFVHT